MSKKTLLSCVLAAAAAAGMVTAVARSAPPPSGGMLPGEPAEAPATQPAVSNPDRPAVSGIAQAPTTAPVAVNQDTPRGTFKMLASAGVKGDPAMLRQVIATTNPSEEKLVSAAANQAQAAVKLQHALASKFPQPGVDNSAAAEQADLEKKLAQIDTFEETITGDTAIVRPKDAPPEAQGMKFTKVNGKWMLPFEVLAGSSASPDQIEKTIPVIDAQTQVYSSAADDVSAGKYKTREEFSQDISARLRKAVQEQIARQVGGATTRPSTQPTAVGQK